MEDDKKEHLLQCQKIREIYNEEMNCKYEDIFAGDVNTLYNVAITMKNLDEIQKTLLNPDDEK